jgi:long-chain acyl-CoA synthetase
MVGVSNPSSIVHGSLAMTMNPTFSHSTLKGFERKGYVGTPQPGVDCKLSGEGEILVKGPGNMVGYYKEPDKTAEVMTEDGYLRTGDRGVIDEEGRLKIVGRTKELFKTSKGKYVAPAPIENILNNDSNIELSLVCGSGQVMTMAIVQLAEGFMDKASKDAEFKKKIESDLTALIPTVNKQIEEFEKVGFIVIAKEPWTIEDGLLTPTMKIKRTQIEEKYAPKMDGWYESCSKTKVLFWEE